jgi:AcrR family transcriptional regulator
MGERTQRRLTAAARRAQLIDIGRQVFAKRGYDAASVEEIAEHARVSKPIIYQHFGGKEGLYAVVVDREMEYLLRRIAESIASGSPRERVERGALAFLEYVRDHPDGFAVLAHGAPATPAGGGMSSLLNDVAERVSEAFVTAFKAVGYDPKAAPIYAHALIGMVTSVGQWWMESRKPSVEEVASHIAALAWRGLRRLPKKPTLATRRR